MQYTSKEDQRPTTLKKGIRCVVLTPVGIHTFTSHVRVLSLQAVTLVSVLNPFQNAYRMVSTQQWRKYYLFLCGVRVRGCGGCGPSDENNRKKQARHVSLSPRRACHYLNSFGLFIPGRASLGDSHATFDNDTKPWYLTHYASTFIHFWKAI